jgi:hypothetical protein
MSPQSEWPWKIADAIGATIIPWDEGLGVSYAYTDGAAEAHAIDSDDWPVLRALERDGKLSFTSDDVRERFTKKLTTLRLGH